MNSGSVSIPSNRVNVSDLKDLARKEVDESQSPRIGSMFRTIMKPHCMITDNKSQSPRIGSMFRTTLEGLGSIDEYKSQSPRIGSMFRNPRATGFQSQSPRIGSMFRTVYYANSRYLLLSFCSSQSPRIGSMFRTLTPSIKECSVISLNPLESGQCFGRRLQRPKSIECPLSQSPRIGSMFRTLDAISAPDGRIPAGLNPLESGQCFGRSHAGRWKILGHGLNPLESGQCFGLDEISYNGSETEQCVSIPSNRVNVSDNMSRDANIGVVRVVSIPSNRVNVSDIPGRLFRAQGVSIPSNRVNVSDE